MENIKPTDVSGPVETSSSESWDEAIYQHMLREYRLQQNQEDDLTDDQVNMR